MRNVISPSHQKYQHCTEQGVIGVKYQSLGMKHVADSGKVVSPAFRPKMEKFKSSFYSSSEQHQPVNRMAAVLHIDGDSPFENSKDKTKEVQRNIQFGLGVGGTFPKGKQRGSKSVGRNHELQE